MLARAGGAVALQLLLTARLIGARIAGTAAVLAIAALTVAAMIAIAGLSLCCLMMAAVVAAAAFAMTAFRRAAFGAAIVVMASLGMGVAAALSIAARLPLARFQLADHGRRLRQIPVTASLAVASLAIARLVTTRVIIACLRTILALRAIRAGGLGIPVPVWPVGAMAITRPSFGGTHFTARRLAGPVGDKFQVVARTPCLPLALGLS